jgi:hypothetical protein
MSERMSVFSDACNHFSLVISLHGHCGYVYMQRDIGVRDDAHSLGGTGEPAGGSVATTRCVTYLAGVIGYALEKRWWCWGWRWVSEIGLKGD